MIGNKNEILNFLENSKEEDIFEIKKKQIKSLRSLAQNRYYYGVVIDIISDFHGYTPIETHELLKATFGVKHFSDLDTKEFKELMETIIDIWKTKYNVIIPLPKDRIGEENLFKSLGF